MEADQLAINQHDREVGLGFAEKQLHPIVARAGLYSEIGGFQIRRTNPALDHAE